jgi:hypothetical protein
MSEGVGSYHDEEMECYIERTHRATTTPRTNKKIAATATPVAPPVTGNEHTSTANIIPP